MSANEKSRSVLYMSMSLDGFIAGPGDDADHGLGVGANAFTTG